MTEHRNIVFSCYLIIAVLGWLVFSRMASSVSAYFDFYVYGNFVEVIVRLVPVVLGITLFAVLYRNAKSYNYMTEVISELRKVTWPASKEVSAATIAVIVAVLISAVLLFLFDSIWSYLIQRVIRYGA